MTVIGTLRYLATFAAGRGLLFVSPIVVANVMPVAMYGQVEWAHAAATLLATGLALGTSSVAPLVELGKEQRTTLLSILVHHISVALALSVLAGGIIALTSEGESMALASLLGAVLLLQSLWSVLLKTRSRNEASILLDAGAFSVIAIAAASGRQLSDGATLRSVAIALMLYGGGLLLATLRETRLASARDPRHLWWEALRCGAPLMIGALVSTFVTTSGRFVIGLVGDETLTGEYGAIVRVGAIPVVAHQVVVIARFRNLYTDDIERIGAAVERILLVVSASAVAFWIVSPVVGPWLGGSFATASARHGGALILVLVQTVFWSGIALNDLLLARQGAMGRALRLTIPCLVVGVAATAGILRAVGASIEGFVVLHSVVMATFFAAQCLVLRASGMSLKRAWILVALIATMGAVGFAALQGRPW